ncbi:cellulase family glycosylhydrolase [Cellulomonas sp. PSBB021]|uniref:cellulase family glycosylhydrolase n=1 Tax=Cellulomonas sp. PSBB021 TaxID=2003551 RepID=UPI000B8DB1CC|nr:cellulase family glycosylhydrolase [Cellulomonas sp. PSBB021]ASR54546.1 glycosyl hydrolase family 5 [Cellulomonas sp. PSBB021]
MSAPVSVTRRRTLRARVVAGIAAVAALAAPLAVAAASPVAAAPTSDWLHTQGNKIVDESGKEVWLTGANWFGFNATERVFHGLWAVNLEDVTRSMAEHGINIVRVPISTQLLLEWKAGKAAVSSGVNTYVNPELVGKTSLEVFDRFLALSEKYGLKVMLDVHSAEADNAGHFHPVWWKGTVTVDDFYSAWEWVTARYKNNDTLVAMDIKNEPHGTANSSPRAKWDSSTDQDNFKNLCQVTGRKILAINPNVLILCEGIEVYPKPGVSWTSTNNKEFYGTWWGGNLRGVTDHPVDLGANQDQLVYSPHDYGPLVFEQDWFQKPFTKATLEADVWDPNWLFIHKKNIAPLLVGEWGGRVGQDERQDRWMTALRDLMIERRISHTFWSLNPNSGDTGGLLLDDWKTWDSAKYELLKPGLWQDGGKFVGLDHQVKLGGPSSTTGKSLSEVGDRPDPTDDPTQDPTDDPTQDPTDDPTQDPTDDPTQDPTDDPTTVPTGSCTVTYQANAWSTGMSVGVKVKNTGTSALSGWSLQFTLPAGQKLEQGWSGTWSQSGQTVTVTNATWNGTLAAGGTVEVGFNGTHTGSTTAPSAFTLNGAACTTA